MQSFIYRKINTTNIKKQFLRSEGNDEQEKKRIKKNVIFLKIRNAISTPYKSK